MLQFLVEIQRDIYFTFADRIRGFAETGDWVLLAAYLPMGVVFGAVHALTPGHSKAVLAAYLTASTASPTRGFIISTALSVTHVTMAVLIVLLSLPLVERALGGVGSAPLLEDISRGALGLIGLWMLWQAVCPTRHAHDAKQGAAFGFLAGLIPCPLTLAVMAFAVARGVTAAGLAFAAVMMLGIAFTLGSVALASVLFRRQLLHVLETKPRWYFGVTRALYGLAGALLAGLAITALAN